MKYAIIELLLAFSVGFIFETFNININQHYSYPYSFFYIGIVPISILVGWYTIFMFGKFWTLLFIGIVNSFKDNKPINITSRISFIPIIVLSTAYLAATIVLLIDPIATRVKWWEWYEPSPYLDVPIGEIYGIFFATCLISIVFWFVFNMFKIDTIAFVSKIDLIMISLYELMCLLLLYWSINSSVNNDDVLIGSSVVYLATQLPFLFTLLLYIISDDYTKVIKKLQSQSELTLKLINYSGYLLSFILFFLILFSMDMFIPLHLGITSIHMIFIQFFFMLILTNFHLTLKIKEIKSDS